MNIKLLYGINLTLLVVSAVLFFAFLIDAEHLLIIHFDEYRGIDFLGDRNDVLYIILFGFVVSGINAILAQALKYKSFYNSKTEISPVQQNLEKNIISVRQYGLGGFFYHVLPVFNVLLSGLILITVAVIISIN